MLADRRAGAAEPLLTLVLAQASRFDATSREEREVLELLHDWDRDSGRRSPGAAVFHVLVAQLLRELFEPALGEALLERYLSLPRVNGTALVLDALAAAERGGKKELPWTAPGFVRKALRASLRGTWISLSVELGTNRERWAWGRLKTLRFEPLWPDAWRGDAARLGPFPYGGDPASVAVAEHRRSARGRRAWSRRGASSPTPRTSTRRSPCSLPGSPSTPATRTRPTASSAGSTTGWRCSRSATR